MNLLEDNNSNASFKKSEEIFEDTPLMIGSQEWRLKRFLENHMTTKPFLCGSSLGSHAPIDSCSSKKILPVRYEQTAKNLLSRQCVPGTVDTSRGRWCEFSSNSNQLPKCVEESQLPQAAIKAGNVASKALNVAGKFALAAAVVIDSYRLGKAVYNDIKEQETLGKRTAKTSASVASGWAGGFAGAAAGNSAGAVIGGSIGAAFGGIGAIPGAAVGSLVGCLVGGVTAGVGASIAAENIVDLISNDDIKGQIFIIDGRHLCIKPSNHPENEEQDEEWLEIVKLVVTLGLLRKDLSIITKQSLTEVLSIQTIHNVENFEENQLHGGANNLEEEYFITQVNATQELLQELCATPQFFCSFLLMLVMNDDLANNCIEKDLRDFEFCTELIEKKRVPSIKNELICMTDAGFALVWFNPQLGVEETLETIIKPHFPYLEIFDNKRLI